MMRVLIVLLAGTLLVPAYAIDPGEALGDPGLEARARALSVEFRCLVCQNQSIDDSDAPLARDLRAMVRARLLAGDSDRDIRAAVTERYGEFVLFRPRFDGATAILWLLPVFLLGIAGWFVTRMFSRTTSSEVE